MIPCHRSLLKPEYHPLDDSRPSLGYNPNTSLDQFQVQCLEDFVTCPNLVTDSQKVLPTSSHLHTLPEASLVSRSSTLTANWALWGRTLASLQQYRNASPTWFPRRGVRIRLWVILRLGVCICVSLSEGAMPHPAVQPNMLLLIGVLGYRPVLHLPTVHCVLANNQTYQPIWRIQMKQVNSLDPERTLPRGFGFWLGFPVKLLVPWTSYVCLLWGAQNVSPHICHELLPYVFLPLY